MITIANEKSIMKGNYKEPKEHKFIQSGTRPFETKILTSLRKGNEEYVSRLEQAKAIQRLANENERVLILQVDGMYELRMKRRGKWHSIALLST